VKINKHNVYKHNSIPSNISPTASKKHKLQTSTDKSLGKRFTTAYGGKVSNNIDGSDFEVMEKLTCDWWKLLLLQGWEKNIH